MPEPSILLDEHTLFWSTALDHLGAVVDNVGSLVAAVGEMRFRLKQLSESTGGNRSDGIQTRSSNRGHQVVASRSLLARDSPGPVCGSLLVFLATLFTKLHSQCSTVLFNYKSQTILRRHFSAKLTCYRIKQFTSRQTRRGTSELLRAHPRLT